MGLSRRTGDHSILTRGLVGISMALAIRLPFPQETKPRMAVERYTANMTRSAHCPRIACTTIQPAFAMIHKTKQARSFRTLSNAPATPSPDNVHATTSIKLNESPHTARRPQHSRPLATLLLLRNAQSVC